MRCRRYLHALPHQLIRHRPAHRLFATPAQGIPRAWLASRLHLELPVATSIHPDTPAIVPPCRTFHTWRRADLSRQLHVGPLSIHVAIILSSVERSAAYPLALASGFHEAGRMTRYAHYKIRLASFIHPDSFLVVAPRPALLARGLAALPHQSRSIPRVRRAVVLLPVIRRTLNDLTVVLLWSLLGQCPTAKRC